MTERKAAPAIRCSYQWSIGPVGRRYVDYYVQCKNLTRREDGRCYLHVGLHGRYDRRPS